MAAEQPVLIAGGGIGGLALALALAQAGRSSIVLERRIAPGTEGAGIQLGPNGVRALRRLGVADTLRRHVGEPDGIEVRNGRSGRLLAQLPLGGWIAARHGAPYWVSHRGDLHATLMAAATADRRILLRTGCEVVSATQSERGVIAACVSGDEIAGAALIGADGLWSSVRRLVAAGTEPRFVGATATRAVMPAEAAGPLARPVVGLWLTPGVHVVHYPVRGGREIAAVVIAAEAWQGSEWDAPADRDLLRGRLAGFHSLLAEALNGVGEWRKSALHRLAPLPHWTSGRIGLLGDAAHPMLPYLGQGGGMAIEDALVLAACLGHGNEEAPALARYERERRGRTMRVQAVSSRNGRIYHMRPPLAWARDGALRLLPGTRLMAGFDWLYGWRPETTVSPW